MTTAARPTRTPYPDDRPRVRYGPLWFGFLGSAAAWAVHELAGYAVLSHACFPRDLPRPDQTIGNAWTVALVTTIAAALVSLASVWAARAVWRRHRPPEGSWLEALRRTDEARAARLLAFGGVLFGLVFLLMIVLDGVSLFVVPICSY